MSNIPSELKFMTSHEWVRPEGDAVYTVGISDHGQAMLGDIFYVDLPDVGDVVNAGDICAVLESVKSVSELFVPLSGEIIAVNDDLDASPALVNSDAYGDGWLFQISIKDKQELDDLLSSDAYQEHLQDDEYEEED